MKPRVARIGCTLLIMSLTLLGAGRDYGRSMVIARQGIAATSQVLASQTGAQILARGGSRLTRLLQPTQSSP